jgi:hypothetical protein
MRPPKIFWSTEEAAQGLASSCRVTREAKGTELRRLWIQNEVDCCLQEADPLYKSGIAHGMQASGTTMKDLQLNRDGGRIRQ